MSRAPLPIDDILPSLQAALDAAPNVVLAAPPGAGKTTRVPLALIDAPWRQGRKILMLEPRRIAARAAAERLAAELGQTPGKSVGYRVRGDSVAGTDIEVVTEGILTRMIQSDPDLPDIAAVLFDEAHERSIHSDLGLALALDIQDALRPDLRLVIMSATLDTQVFARLLGNAPIIESPGRMFPVDTIWLDRSWRKPGQGRRGFEAAMAAIIQTALTQQTGDVLAFLPGAGEIDRVQSMLRSTTGALVRPLHGSLPFDQQRKALQPDPDGHRRVILATAIAETSVTVPGVTTVVDGGLARRAQTDHGTGLSRLITTSVSRAQADQRRGRAGRLGPGTCYRMWTKGEEGSFAAFPPPEIAETELSGLALELALWGVKDAAGLRFPNAPPAKAFDAARTLLTELGALDASGLITGHGRAIAKQPMHPRLAHMVIAAKNMGLGPEAALIAAILSERDPVAHGSGADLNLRLQAILSGNGPSPAARSAIQRIKSEAKRYAKTLPQLNKAQKAAGPLAALAYPDRIAQRRPGDAPRFLLSNGRGALIDAADPLSGQSYLVAINLQDGTEARIRIAATLTEAELRSAHSDQITETTTVDWSQRHKRVESRKRDMFGALALTDQVWKDAAPQDLGEALADGIRSCGIAALPWPKAAQALRRRVRWLRDRGATDLPDWSEQALADPDPWLTDHLAGLRRIEDIAALDLTQILRSTADWQALQSIDTLAPITFETASGRKVPIDYAQDQPVIAVRLHELYGVAIHPTIGRPAVPLVLEILSPANRPVQKTADLPGFWTSSYGDVRKDMRARYPKHDWPEDPVNYAPKAKKTQKNGS